MTSSTEEKGKTGYRLRSVIGLLAIAGIVQVIDWSLAISGAFASPALGLVLPFMLFGVFWYAIMAPIREFRRRPRPSGNSAQIHEFARLWVSNTADGEPEDEKLRTIINYKIGRGEELTEDERALLAEKLDYAAEGEIARHAEAAAFMAMVSRRDWSDALTTLLTQVRLSIRLCRVHGVRASWWAIAACLWAALANAAVFSVLEEGAEGLTEKAIEALLGEVPLVKGFVNVGLDGAMAYATIYANGKIVHAYLKGENQRLTLADRLEFRKQAFGRLKDAAVSRFTKQGGGVIAEEAVFDSNSA